MEIQPKDPSKGHFYVSVCKSAVRIAAGASLIMGSLVVCGALLILAEILGIVEEVVWKPTVKQKSIEQMDLY